MTIKNKNDGIIKSIVGGYAVRGLSIEYEMRSSQSSASSCSLANSMALSTSPSSSIIICRARRQFPILPEKDKYKTQATFTILAKPDSTRPRLTEQEDGLLDKVPLLTHLQSLEVKGEMMQSHEENSGIQRNDKYKKKYL